MKKKTLEEVLLLFNKTWGDRYNYRHITPQAFKGASKEVPIECNKHGIFWMTPCDHYHHHGCPDCDHERKKEPKFYERKLLFGVGKLDVDYSINTNELSREAYRDWYEMLKRCYNENNLKLYPTYRDCYVCEEWKCFSNFKKWFEDNHISGYCLDKDILIKGNKKYAPDTCCYIPQEINKLLLNKKMCRGKYPIGVYKSIRNGKYIYYSAKFHKNGEDVNLGYYPTPQDAFQAYKAAKESHIQDVATLYFEQGKITKKVYNALLNYEVEITD